MTGRMGMEGGVSVVDFEVAKREEALTIRLVPENAAFPDVRIVVTRTVAKKLRDQLEEALKLANVANGAGPN
jgi:hypothetical protein